MAVKKLRLKDYVTSERVKIDPVSHREEWGEAGLRGQVERDAGREILKRSLTDNGLRELDGSGDRRGRKDAEYWARSVGIGGSQCETDWREAGSERS